MSKYNIEFNGAAFTGRMVAGPPQGHFRPDGGAGPIFFNLITGAVTVAGDKIVFKYTDLHN
ncbi:MAG: hypothetical protein JXA46_11275 [Dehalococcoidales bacterium]|nr:hypothetical protein [Dehalococcoidales bacterium]